MQQFVVTYWNLPFGWIVKLPFRSTFKGEPVGFIAPPASIAYVESVSRKSLRTYANLLAGSSAMAVVPEPPPSAPKGEPGIWLSDPFAPSIEKPEMPASDTAYACRPSESTAIPVGSAPKSASANGDPGT